MFVESYQITSEQIVELIQTFKTGLDIFVELHQFCIGGFKISRQVSTRL